MRAGLAIQYAIVGLAVLASLWIAWRKLAPQRGNRWLAGTSIRLRLHGRSRFAKWLGRRLQPKQATGNCADGCASCGACGTKRPAQVHSSQAAVLRYRAPSR